MTERESVETSLKVTLQLPPRPQVLIDLQEEVAKEDPELPHIERIISKDPGIAGAVLSLANSPAFYRRRKVLSLAEAIQLVGIKSVAHLVLSEALRQRLSDGSPLLERFWESSATGARLASQLAASPALRLLAVSAAEGYAFGLLRDCGLAVLMLRLPEYAATADEYLADLAIPEMARRELSEHQISHCHTGFMVAERWQLPPSWGIAIRYHHDFDRLAPDDSTIPTDAVRLICLSQLVDAWMLSSAGKHPDHVIRILEAVEAATGVPVVILRELVGAVEAQQV